MHRLVCMFRPIVDKETVCAVKVEPSARDESVNQFVLIAPVVDCESNVFIAQFPNVSPPCLGCGKVPNAFQKADPLIDGDV